MQERAFSGMGVLSGWGNIGSRCDPDGNASHARAAQCTGAFRQGSSRGHYIINQGHMLEKTWASGKSRANISPSFTCIQSRLRTGSSDPGQQTRPDRDAQVPAKVLCQELGLVE